MSLSPTDNSDSEKQALAKQLDTMNKLFFAGLSEHALGHRTDPTYTSFFDNATSLTVFEAALNKCFQNHDNNEAFFGVGAPALTTNVQVKMSGLTSVYANVPMKNGSATWKTEIRDKLNAGTYVVDINLYSLATNADCRNLLDALYAWHDLCNEDNWNNYMKGQTVTLKKANLISTSGLNDSSTVSKDGTSDLKTNMNNLLHFTTMEAATNVDRFMVQRLMYVYIRLIQFQLAMRYAYRTYTDTTGTPATAVISSSDQSIAWALPATIIGILERDTQGLTDVIKKVEDITLKKKAEYKGLNDNINQLHDTIDNQKTYIKNQVDRVGTESVYEAKGKSMMIAAVVILAAVVIGAIVVLVLPLDKPRKLMGAGAVLGVASLAALILSIVFSKLIVEGFSSAYVDPYGYQQLMSGIDFAKGNTLFCGEIRRSVLQYLQQCSILVSAVKSYQILGNVNFTMTKENRYFNDMTGQMTIAGEKIKGTYRTSDLVQKQYSANMYLCITLSIIIGASLLSLVAFENLPMLRTIALTVAGFFVVLALIIYVLEYSAYVRTDGDKKYWSQPPNTGVMTTA